MMMEKNEIDFEKAMNRLEVIVEKLGEGGLTLDEAMKLYEEGANLIRFCRERLTKAKGKLEILKLELEESEREVSFSEISEDAKDFISELDEGSSETKEEVNEGREEKTKGKRLKNEGDLEGLF
ncbi:MAG: exodeoxyribonuclease VII small subunit [bacterium]